MLSFRAIPHLFDTSHDKEVWAHVVDILEAHGFTHVYMLCEHGDLNKVSSWLNTEEWKIFVEVCYEHIKTGMGGPPPFKKVEKVWVNI